MSNILILQGSVRKDGNTAMLANAFADGARTHYNVEIISVGEMNIHPCIGCNSCFGRDDHSCCQNDDMKLVYQKMQTADVLVLASPVYFYGISAQLKAVIDRFHTPMRDSFPVKKLGLILVGAASLPQLFDAIKMQYQLVLNYFHLENVGMVLARGCKDKGDVRNTVFLEEARKLGLSV